MGLLAAIPAATAEERTAPALIEVLPAPVPVPVPAPAVTATAPAPTAPLARPATAPAATAPVTDGAGVAEAATAPPAVMVASTPDPVPAALDARLSEGTNLWPGRLGRREREGVSDFYRVAAHQPLWIREGDWSPAARALAAQLLRAGEDGLEPADYPVPVIAPAGRPASTADLAEAEIKLSALAVLYARDARGGRLDPTRLSALITPKLDLPGAEAVLASLRAAPDPAAALAGFNPPHPGFLALRTKLAELRASRPALEPMAQGPGRRGLATHSIAVLGEPPPVRANPAGPRLEAEIVSNMERWRWLPADLGTRHIAVNIPEFRLRLVENGRSRYETRVITGRTETPTPVFSGLMDHAIVNPSWYVPPSILKKEILPGLAADPLYAERRGYEVIRRGNSITVRQPPGERNALGFIKFMFPNGHAVYLHDTPNRNLFGAARRAFSHGCVRVEDPFRLADFVLGENWTESRLRRLIGRGERTIFLPAKLPVHLTYFTLTVDESGELRSFEDLYGHSRRTRAALGLAG